MAVIGAILGDIAGSQYEFERPKNLNWKSCDLFTDNCVFTDDTVMSLAIKYAIDNNLDYKSVMRTIGKQYIDCGYGPSFFNWIMSDEDPDPYGSFGNGAAMRVSYIGQYFENIDDVIEEASKSASISHNHPEGIKGAITTAVCVWMAKHNYTKKQIVNYVLLQYPKDQYPWNAELSLEYLQQHYSWDVTCMTCISVAIVCFKESNSYEEFIRNVFSLDCDTDTICAIGGGIAEEYYKGTGIDNEKILERYLDNKLYNILFNKEENHV